MPGKHLSILVHFIWSTQERSPWIFDDWESRLYADVGGILNNKGAKLLAAGGRPDHVHFLVSMPSTISIADMVNAMKANSSRWVHENLPNHSAFAWQNGYGAFSVSASQRKHVEDYIRTQDVHHQVKPFQQEYIEFLKKHGIDYDDQYLWN
jgi:REP element-mobilizing transposase RayT